MTERNQFDSESLVTMRDEIIALRKDLEAEEAWLDLLVSGSKWLHLDAEKLGGLTMVKWYESGVGVMSRIQAANLHMPSASVPSQLAIDAIYNHIGVNTKRLARIEVCQEKIRIGLAFAGKEGVCADQTLRGMGANRGDPEMLAAIFEIARKVTQYEVHRDWTNGSEEAPDRFRKRLLSATILEAKKLRAVYGMKYETSKRKLYLLGAEDRELSRETKSAAKRYATGGDWSRERTVALDTDNLDPNLYRLDSRAAQQDRPMQNDQLEIIMEFREVAASTKELELLDALRLMNSPTEALQLVGDGGNQSRMDSLKRRICRFQAPN